MNKQIILFLKYFLSIQDGTNKDIKDYKIKEITFNPKFYHALIKQQYIRNTDITFRGYPFTVDYEEGADNWGMFLEPVKQCNLID